MDQATIKQKVCDAIVAHRAEIEAIAEAILAEPELGFKEVKTSKKVQDALSQLGIEFTTDHGLTGVKARLKGRTSKRTIAMLAELDAIVCRNHKNADPVTGAAHCCGHNIQIANMIAVACGLRDVMQELDGDVVLFAVPAEEYVEIDWRGAQRQAKRLKYLGGKQQLIAEGAFDDIDMAMQMHVATGTDFNLGASSNGFIGKLIEYHGRPAHAAFAPEEGINALNAAMMGVMGVNAIRETFRDQDHVRFHPIINAGGDLVNVIPDYVKMESYVRASNIDAMARYNKAVDRALKAGADAIGATCTIQNLPGYLPLRPDEAFRDVLRDNAADLFGEANVTLGEHSAGSTDMGDVSHLMPVVHPWVGCVDGVLHGADYQLRDREVAYIKTPQVLAMTIVDLLVDGAAKADAICKAFKPQLNRESYVTFMDEIK